MTKEATDLGQDCLPCLPSQEFRIRPSMWLFWSLGLSGVPDSALRPQVCYIVPFLFTRHLREVWTPGASKHRLTIPVRIKTFPGVQTDYHLGHP